MHLCKYLRNMLHKKLRTPCTCATFLLLHKRCRNPLNKTRFPQAIPRRENRAQIV